MQLNMPPVSTNPKRLARQQVASGSDGFDALLSMGGEF